MARYVYNTIPSLSNVMKCPFTKGFVVGVAGYVIIRFIDYMDQSRYQGWELGTSTDYIDYHHKSWDGTTLTIGKCVVYSLTYPFSALVKKGYNMLKDIFPFGTCSECKLQQKSPVDTTQDDSGSVMDFADQFSAETGDDWCDDDSKETINVKKVQ